MEVSFDFSKVKSSYETVFIVSPELSEAEYKALADKFEKLIKDNGGEIVSKELWGKRKLAYKIDKKAQGYYVLMQFNAIPVVIEKLEQEYKYDVNVIRYLTTKLDKYALAFNEKRRTQGFANRKAVAQ